MLFKEMSDWVDPCLPMFHTGQLLARDGDIPAALLQFEEALRISRSQFAECGQEYLDWIHYVEATIAYLNNDLVTLECKIPEIKWNKEVVKRLYDDLVTFGSPCYERAYSGLRQE